MIRVSCCQAGVSLATFVLPVAVADAQSMAEAVESIDAVLDMPLLHRAVRSQSVPLVSRDLLPLDICPEACICSILRSHKTALQMLLMCCACSISGPTRSEMKRGQRCGLLILSPEDTL